MLSRGPSGGLNKGAGLGSLETPIHWSNALHEGRMRYDDFYLQLDSQPQGGFRVRVLSSPAGEGNARLHLELDAGAIGASLQAEGLATRSGGLTDSRHFAGPEIAHRPPPPSAQEVGEQLFDSLFSGRVRSLLDQSLGKLQGQAGRGLRIKLKLDPADPALGTLADLPWELLCRPDTEDFLALSRLSPVVRYLDVPRPCEPIPFTPPLRILGVTASPGELAGLDLAEERRRLEKIDRESTGIDVRFLEHASMADLRETLLEGRYHALHFMGHGDFDPSSGEGVLFFERPDGSAEVVSGRALATTLKDFRELGLVLLNACNTAKADAQAGRNAFRGVATALVLGGLPAVAAMQFPISDTAAIAFSAAFYRQLARGESVEASLSEGRQAIHAVRPGALEWAIPVLFQRVADGNVFTLRAATELPSSEPQPKPARLPTVSAAQPPTVTVAAPILGLGTDAEPPRRWSPKVLAGVGGAASAVIVVGGLMLWQGQNVDSPSSPGDFTEGSDVSQLPQSLASLGGQPSGGKQPPAGQSDERGGAGIRAGSSQPASSPLSAKQETTSSKAPQPTMEAVGRPEPPPVEPATSSDPSALATQVLYLGRNAKGGLRLTVRLQNTAAQALDLVLDGDTTTLSDEQGQTYSLLRSSLPEAGSGYRVQLAPGAQVEASLEFQIPKLGSTRFVATLTTASGVTLDATGTTQTLTGSP